MSSEDERYDLLIGFLEGELDDDERELVEGELAGPSDAQDRLEAYRGLSAALAELEPPAPSAEARDRAYAAVMAAMAEDSAAAPVEARIETSAAAEELAQAKAGAQLKAGQGPEGGAAAAPRGQLLRFLSASAAAALVLISALFYLRGLETPQARIAAAPNKVAMEESAAARGAGAPAVGQAAHDAELDESPAAAPRPESAGFAELEASEGEALNEDEAKQIDRYRERVREEMERERAALAKKLEEGAAPIQSSELFKPNGVRGNAAPDPETSGEDGGMPRTLPAEPAAPRSDQPDTKAFGAKRRLQDEGDRSNDSTPADASEPMAGGELAKNSQRGHKKSREAQRAAERKEVPPAPRPRRSMGGQPKPRPGGQPDADGAPRQRGLRPEADSSGGGGGGGGASRRSAPKSEARDDEQAAKGKTLAGAAGSGQAAGEPPLAGRRDAGAAEDGFREEKEESLQRFRLRGAAKAPPVPSITELQPAWIVTRGRERVLYVMEGTKLTQAPFPDLDLPDAPVKAEKKGDLQVKPLQVSALVVQRQAMATKRKPVDLRVLERREDLLAIAKLELARDETRGARGKGVGAPARPDPSRPGGPGGGAPAGKKAGEADSPQDGSLETGKTGQQQAEPQDHPAEAEPEAGRAPGAQAEGKKPPLPAPAAGRDRAELLLRLLGALEVRRPSRVELQRALLDAERRQVKARRR